MGQCALGKGWEGKNMADTSVSFKCPNCGGPLAYKPGQGEKSNVSTVKRNLK